MKEALFRGGIKMTKRQWVAAGAGLFILGGVLGIWFGRMSPAFAVRQTAQEDVMYGFALFREADSALAQGHVAAAEAWSNQGIGSLVSALLPLSRLGISNANTVVPYLEKAQYDRLHHQATRQEQQVLETFQASFAPFSRDGYGYIPEAAFQAAWDRVAAKIGS